MLSAFTARPIIELRSRDKSKIESVLAYGDRVLVGLNTGVLRVYRINEIPKHDTTAGPSTSSSTTGAEDAVSSSVPDPSVVPPALKQKPSDLLREVERFSTRAIEQLAIIKEANTLVSLSNYHVSLYDLATYELMTTLQGTKNATCFATTSNIVKDPSTGIPEIISRLAVAVKRKLLLWNWHESELSPDVVEITLPESIRTITWANATSLVVGMNSNYTLVDVTTQSVSEISNPGTANGTAASQGRFGAMGTASMGYMGLGSYMLKPLSAKLAPGELLLAKDINTLFIDENGQGKHKRQIPWQTAPESIGYSYPYLLALQPPTKGFLEVRNPDTLSLLQFISLPGAAQLHFPPPTVSLAHAGKGFHISSERCIWTMDATDYDSQVASLIESEQYDEAVSVLVMLEDALLKDKDGSLREAKMRKAEVLFRHKKYRDALDLFNEDAVHAPPERVLKLYPPSIVGEYSGWPDLASDESEEESISEEAESRPSGEAINAHPTDTPATPNSVAPTNGSRPSTPGTANGPAAATGGFVRMFMGANKSSDAASTKSTSSDIADANDPKDKESPSTPGQSQREKKKKQKKKKHSYLPLMHKDLLNAVLELNSYLAGTRARLQRVIDPATGKLKPREKGTAAEQTLKRLLSSQSQAGAGTVSDAALEEQLKNTFILVDTTLFRAYMFSRPSLAGSLFRIPNFCAPDVVHAKLWEHSMYHELIDFFYGKKLHEPALKLLKEFGAGDKPDEKAPSLHGPQRTIRYLQGLGPVHVDLILEYAEWTLKSDPEEAIEIFVGDTENAETLPRDRIVEYLSKIDPVLEIQYLEHIIKELNDLTPDFHNRLAELFVDYLKESKRDEKWENMMNRFVGFLRSSRQYSLSRAFSTIPRDEPAFYEAQAAVLSLMGNHKQALEIYAFKMEDYAKAEEYCNQVHRSQQSSTRPVSRPVSSAGPIVIENEANKPTIYHTLLSLYINPPSPYSQKLPPALALLSRHGARLPAESTLSLLPETLPVADLEAYFRGRMRASTSLVHESRIVAGLRAAELIGSQNQLLLGDDLPGGQGTKGRNRRVVVTEDRVCGVCHKRLGGSVVAVTPESAVIHYGCLGRASNGVGANVEVKSESLKASGWGRKAGTGAA